MTELEYTPMQTANEAKHVNVQIEEVDTSNREVERRFEGQAVLESDVARPVLVRRYWGIDSTGTVHEYTHYYAANEPSSSAHVYDMEAEWTPATDDLRDELMANLTMDPQAEIDSLLATVSERVAKRRLGVGNQ